MRKSACILIIEDDAVSRLFSSRVLQEEGYGVVTAEKAAEGITLIRQMHPDLILCDIMMPGMDGHSVLEFLKSDSSIADIPFIFCSALSDRADVRTGMCEGADDYLTKPFTAEELIATVAGRLERIGVFRQQRERAGALQEEEKILLNKLTSREWEILRLVGSGCTSKDIAEQLGIRMNTVEVHRANLMKKLDASNAAQLARWAFIAEQISNSDI